MNLKDAKYGHLLEDNYEDALSLKNRYAFLNANLFPNISKREQEYVLELEELAIKWEPKVLEHLDNVYPLFPMMQEAYAVPKTFPEEEVMEKTKLQFLSGSVLQFVCPELQFAYGASQLCSRALLHNPNRNEFQQKAYEEILAGTKIGGIGITEPRKGSDSVNMEATAKINEDGTITYNGQKIYTTNGAIADYMAVYGCTDISNPRQTMMLTLFQRGDEGLIQERINVPAVPGIGIGKITYNNVTVSKDRMMASPGDGYRRLFRGLTPERIGIVTEGIAFIWNSIAHGAIFTQMRHQFGKPLFKYQGISTVLADLYSRISSHTAFALQICDSYDKNILSAIMKGEKPNPEYERSIAINTAQAKYITAKMAHEAAYEVVQLMGGRGATDDFGSHNMMNRIENMSRIIEVVGGHRNIQLKIVESGLVGTSLPSIYEHVKQSKAEEAAVGNVVFGLYVKRAQSLLKDNLDFLSDQTKIFLKDYLAKLDAAAKSKNVVELGAYGKALPKLVITAEKEVYRAKKGKKV